MANTGQTALAVMGKNPNLLPNRGSPTGGIVPPVMPGMPPASASRPSSAITPPAASAHAAQPGGINPLIAQRLMQALGHRRDDEQDGRPQPGPFGDNGGRNPFA